MLDTFVTVFFSVHLVVALFALVYLWVADIHMRTDKADKIVISVLIVLIPVVGSFMFLMDNYDKRKQFYE